MPLVNTGEDHIQSIRGDWFHEGQEYKLTIKGTGLTPRSERAWNEFVVLVNADTTSPQLNQFEEGRVEIVFDRALIDPHFTALQAVSLPISIHITRYRKVRYWIFFTKTVVSNQVLNLNATLIPKIVAEIEVNGVRPIYGWGKKRTESTQWTGPNMHCSKNCKNWYGAFTEKYSRRLPGGNSASPKPGHQRVTKVYGLEHIGGPGGYDMDHATGISGDRTRAWGRYRARTRPTTYRFRWDYETYGLLRNQDVKRELRLEKGGSARVRFNKAVKGIVVKGQDLFGKRISLDPLAANNTDPLIRIGSNQVAGNVRILTIQTSQLVNNYCQ